MLWICVYYITSYYVWAKSGWCVPLLYTIATSELSASVLRIVSDEHLGYCHKHQEDVGLSV